MSDHHQKIPEERLFYFDQQEITLDDFHTTGFILDIGGGGDGLIGILKGSQVIAIDPNKNELEEAAPGPIKIVMDATSLDFIDHSFDTVTSFFTLMYVKGDNHKSIFSEAFRVLVPGGRFRIWDVIFPPRSDKNKDIAVFPVIVQLPDKLISTGYGVEWPEDGSDLDHYKGLAKETGFEIVSNKTEASTFYLELLKPK